MLAAMCLTTVSSLGVAYASGEEQNTIAEWLSTPVLGTDETRDEIEQFVKNRIPPLELPADPGQWPERSESLRRELFDKVVLRGVPAQWTDGEVQVEWCNALETDKGYRIRKLRYEALPGLWIPALLYEPQTADKKIPAVLNVNGHVGPPGKAMDYEQVRCINLAKRGMLALHPEWLAFGELGYPGLDHNRLAYLDVCGTSGVAVFYLAMKRGLDVLTSYPSADPDRVAMTGLSGGGWQTIILSALDTRISLAVPNAGYIGLAERVEHVGDMGDLEQNPTDLVSVADYTHLTAMLAPRPALLIYNEKDECCFEAYRARASVYEPVLPFYDLFGKADGFLFYENKDPGTHNYERDNREQFYRFINRHFLPESQWVDEEIPCDDELLTPEDLHAGAPENNATFFTLARALMKDLPMDPGPEPGAAEFARWQDRSRNRLREILRFKPVKAPATVVKVNPEGSSSAALYKISAGDEWSVPAVAIANTAEEPSTTAIVFADKGRASVAEVVAAQLREGARVVAVDPLLMGECAPLQESSWKLAMLIATVGERPLGIQVGQLIAVIDWARREFETKRVTLHATGWNAGVAALAACALSPESIDRVSIQGMPESLKLLVENPAAYNQHPALFCFGLLQHFDIAQLTALSAPTKVDVTLSNSS